MSDPWRGDVSLGVRAWAGEVHSPAPPDPVADVPEADPESVARKILLDQLTGQARSRQQLADKLAQTVAIADKAIDTLAFQDALTAINELVGAVNGYVTEQEPWKVAKDESQQARLATILYTAAETLRADGFRARVVSMPCQELFEHQDQAYRDSVLPPSVRARVAVEQASTLGWHRYVGIDGAVIGMETFGASAPLKELLTKFGFTPDKVVETAKQVIARAPH